MPGIGKSTMLTDFAAVSIFTETALVAGIYLYRVELLTCERNASGID